MMTIIKINNHMSSTNVQSPHNRSPYKNEAESGHRIREREKLRHSPYKKRLDTELINRLHSEPRIQQKYPQPLNLKQVEQKILLPSIRKRGFSNAHRRRGMSEDVYDRNFGRTFENDTDTDLDAIQYLGECERIIENLKKLTNSSSRRVGKITRSRNLDSLHINTDPAEPDYAMEGNQSFRRRERNTVSRQIMHMGVPESPYPPKRSGQYIGNFSSLYQGTIQKNEPIRQKVVGQRQRDDSFHVFDEVSGFSESGNNVYRDRNGSDQGSKEKQLASQVEQTGHEVQEQANKKQKDKQRAEDEQKSKKKNEVILNLLKKSKLNGGTLQERVVKHKLKFSTPKKTNIGQRQKNQQKVIQIRDQVHFQNDVKEEEEEGKDKLLLAQQKVEKQEKQQMESGHFQNGFKNTQENNEVRDGQVQAEGKDEKHNTINESNAEGEDQKEGR